MPTLYYTAASLDGFLADPDHALDWLLQFPMTDDYPAFLQGVGAVAMGATTYEWVRADLARTGAAWPYEVPVWVFTSRDRSAPEGADVRFVRGDVRPVHAAMVEAAAGRDIWLVGGGDLVGQFHDHGLLDEVVLTVAPVTLGAGAPLLPRRIATPPLRLVSAAPVAGTFVQIRYAVPRG